MKEFIKVGTKRDEQSDFNSLGPRGIKINRVDGGGIVGKAGNQVIMLAQRKGHRAGKPRSALEDRKRRQRKEVWFPRRKQN